MATVGVEVITGSRPGPGENELAPAATYFVVGQAERGDTADVELVRSMSEYAGKLGSRVSYGAVFDDLETFFAEGGSRAYVARVVGPAATKGTRTLNDRAGAPAPTVRIDAVDPGAWSSGLTVEVAAGVLANTYKLILRLGSITETFDNLATPADAVTALAGSTLARATNLGSATAAPNNNPAVAAATALSAGTDDRASIVAGTYTAALARFIPDLGAGLVSIPGQAHSAVAAALQAHAKANNRIFATAPPAGTDVVGAVAAAGTLRGLDGPEFGGLFYPWVQIPDGAGGLRTISPEGYVAGVRARAHARVGPWRLPAGDIAVARHVVGLERTLTRSDIDTLFDSAVSPIRSGPIRLYGWRSLSADTLNFRDLNGREVLNYLAVTLNTDLEELVFSPIDSRGHFFARMRTKIEARIRPIADAGGLYGLSDAAGNPVDPGYVIDTGPSVNPPDDVGRGHAKAAVSVRVAEGADLITTIITKVATATGF